MLLRRPMASSTGARGLSDTPSCSSRSADESQTQVAAAPATSLLPETGADQALLLLEVEWRQRMEAPLRTLADFEAQLMDAIDRVEESLPAIVDR